jgi:hypothetical protein
MLVCNVALRPPRSAIAADLVEIAEAIDQPATGTLVLATLVDDPASVGDLVDAYLGEIMIEAASANTVLDAGLAYVAAVDEATTATATQDAAATTLISRHAMLPGVFVNSDGTARQGNANGIMVNL